MQSGATLEQILAEPPDTKAGVQVRTPKTIGQRAQGFGNLLPLGDAQFLHPLPQAGMEIDPHSLPVNGFVRPAARALRTSAFTA